MLIAFSGWKINYFYFYFLQSTGTLKFFIDLARLSHWYYYCFAIDFTIVPIFPGVFAVTFSVVFAYVADVTEESERSWAYGLVSATFAASLVTSPALGAWIEQHYRQSFFPPLPCLIVCGSRMLIKIQVQDQKLKQYRVDTGNVGNTEKVVFVEPWHFDADPDPWIRTSD